MIPSKNNCSRDDLEKMYFFFFGSGIGSWRPLRRKNYFVAKSYWSHHKVLETHQRFVQKPNYILISLITARFLLASIHPNHLDNRHKTSSLEKDSIDKKSFVVHSVSKLRICQVITFPFLIF